MFPLNGPRYYGDWWGKQPRVRRHESRPAVPLRWLARKIFSGQSEGGISNASGTRSVRVSAQGLSRSCWKLSPMKIPSSRLVAPGSPRMATTRVNRRFRANNTGFSTGLYPVYATSYWWPCGADGGTVGHVTITSLPKFLGLTGYQISLAMMLRWRASARAPLTVSAIKNPRQTGHENFAPYPSQVRPQNMVLHSI